MRPLALVLAVLLLPLAAHAGGEIDLTPRSRKRNTVPKFVFRAEGGTEYSPFGMAGGCFSYLTDDNFEFELGAGAGFPGVQIGFAARRLFGTGGSFLVFELFVAGNPIVNRSKADRNVNAIGSEAKGSVWTSVGGGFEQRLGAFDLSVTGGLVLTTSFTPQYALHGGIGFGF